MKFLSLSKEDKERTKIKFLTDNDTNKYVKCPAIAKSGAKQIIKFEIEQSNSSHNSFIRYKRLDTNVEEVFYFNQTSEIMTHIVYDGKNLTCTNGFRTPCINDHCPVPDCQNLSPFRTTPAVIKEIDFNPRDGIVPNRCDVEKCCHYYPEFAEWERNKYSISASYYLPTDKCTGILMDK